jgi:hypothetical protein
MMGFVADPPHFAAKDSDLYSTPLLGSAVHQKPNAPTYANLR